MACENETPIATGKVHSLALNGEKQTELCFGLEGPVGDSHSGFTRRLSGHDGTYLRTSALQRGGQVFNWRTWTGISHDEIAEVEQVLGCEIPPGLLLENLAVVGIPNFSQLSPTSRLVFPERGGFQAILAIWEENGPCRTVGERLADLYERQELVAQLVREAQGKRGVMGIVLSAGVVYPGDEVLVYPPVR